MKKNTLLKIINPILAVVFLYQVGTGLMHDIIPKEIFEAVHIAGAFTLIVFVIIHLVLNWNWVKLNFFKKHGKPQ